MSKESLTKRLSVIVAAVTVFLALIYVGGAMGYRGRFSAIRLSSPKSSTGVLAPGTVVRQVFSVPEKNISRFALHVAQGSRPVFRYAFTQGDKLVAAGDVDGAAQAGTVELLREAVAVEPQAPVTLTLTVGEGNDAAFAYGDTYRLARGEAAISDIDAETCLYVGDQRIYGKISAEGASVTYMNVQTPFLLLSAAVIALTIGWACWVKQKEKRGQRPLTSRVLYGFGRYWFVMSQMINRDFKTKYKRSVLGIFWSFLNPLLTMGVQYVVFSTLFKSDIPYFPVYLMTGIVCFTFFSEGTNAGLSSVTGNAALLTKVYIPKYIFPVSRVLSSGINFLFSLIPLVIIVLLSGLPITRAYLLLPYVMGCLLVLITGVAMLLGTMMVFFRDMQFLWGVAISLLMYATPIFYPETILNDKLLLVAKLNPLYHVIRFMRAVIIDGASPEPKAYLFCLIACALPALIGVWVFKRNQDKFILNL